ncbi:MAG TPA: cyclic nucleotide-binding domain-containing protein [Polyangiaceae bacterium]|jgi:Fe-S-cluster-containing dehydrogenase component/CRP-like cAMP-binding protein
MTRWPQAVWTSAWLRGVDAVGREAIEAAGTLRSLAKGARVFAPGEPADAVFVVGEGLVDVRAVRRGETEARSLRRAVAGDTLGEEAIVRAGASRASEATCATEVVVAEVPAAVFRRAVGKVTGGAGEGSEAALLRAAGRDVLRTSAVGAALSDADVEALVAASAPRALARDEVLFAAGDPATHVFVVGDGMVQARDGGEGKARVRAYLSRGDLVADGALEGGGAHDVTVAACGSAWVLAVPREALVRALRRSPGALDRARRLTRSAPVAEATRHVMGDLWRFATAGSMLVIDDEACVRCGACAAACAGSHDDGVSRLVRRGEKVAVRDAQDGSQRALLIPGSCQHCKHPACMIDCPTGAIGREPSGGVFVREELCVGCGRCESACPWGAVQMAPRVEDGKRRLPLAPPSAGVAAPPPVAALSAEVAVKCDLCVAVPSGPACVSACPVDAIVRIEPVAAISEVRRAVGRHVPRQALPRARPGAAWVAGAGVVAMALVAASGGLHGLRMLTGVLSGLLVAALAGYAVVKRVRVRRAPSPVSRVRPHAIAHAALGVLAIGIVAAHTGLHASANAAGALLVAFAVASLTGALGATAYRLVPKALSRVERRALLREDLAGRARDLDDRAFGSLTGRSEATKAVYRRWLAPYARSPLGAIALVARRSTLRDEERSLRGRVEAVLGARTATLDGMDDLVRAVVERRALRAQRLLQTMLQGWVPLHVVAVAVTLALLAIHVVLVTRGR